MQTRRWRPFGSFSTSRAEPSVVTVEVRPVMPIKGDEVAGFAHGREWRAGLRRESEGH